MARLSKTRKIILAIMVVDLLIILIVCYPFFKLEYISRFYSSYGSYVIFPDESRSIDTKPIKLRKQTDQYALTDMKITNVLYYPELKQLSFGFVYYKDQINRYELRLIDSRNQEVPGELLVTGGESFYNRYLQKLNVRLEGALTQQVTYTILVVNESGNRVGALDFIME